MRRPTEIDDQACIVKKTVNGYIDERMLNFECPAMVKETFRHFMQLKIVHFGNSESHEIVKQEAKLSLG